MANDYIKLFEDMTKAMTDINELVKEGKVDYLEELRDYCMETYPLIDSICKGFIHGTDYPEMDRRRKELKAALKAVVYSTRESLTSGDPYSSEEQLINWMRMI